MPARRRLTYRSTRTRVLPVPAEASSTMFREGSVAAARAAPSGSGASSTKGSRSSDVTDVVLPAHAGKPARFAPIHIVRRRRKVAGSDRVDRRSETLLRFFERAIAIAVVLEQRHHAARSLEGKVCGFADLPISAASGTERLGGTDAVNRKLQCFPAVLRRPAQLVVDQPERSVGEQIDAIGFAAYRNRSRAVRRSKHEFAAQLVLEQPLDDGGWTPGLHASHCLAEAGGGRRPEKPLPLESRLGVGKRLERVVDDGHEHRPGFVEVSRRYGALAGCLPRGEETLEDLVYE